MDALPPADPEVPTLTLAQALVALAHAHRALGVLDTAYAALEQRLTEHLARAQFLSDALAVERTARLDLQAQLAYLERQLRQSYTIDGRPMQEHTHQERQIP